MPEESNSNTTKTIFLIEEDDDVRPNLKKNLREQGYRVLVAADLEDALEWISVTQIPSDLVLINLVGASVEEALSAGRQIRSRAKYDGHTPLVVVPEKIPAELEGADDNVGGNDWVCYYDDGTQLRELLRRLTSKDTTQKQ
jgi:DNA-binding response OmpR family regulator